MLKNPRHEAFAQAVASGTSGTEAYRRVYGAKANKNAENLACRLSRNVNVRQRVSELQQKSATATTLSLQEKREFLAKLVRTPIGSIDETSELCQAAEYQVSGGLRGRLRRGQADRGNEQGETEVTTVRIKLADKLKAIELDAKLAGEFTEDHRVTLTVQTSPDVVLDTVRTMSPVLAGLTRGRN